MSRHAARKESWPWGRGPAAILLALSLAAGGKAGVWHVAQKPLAGIDPNCQVRTVGEVTARLKAGDTAYIHGGIYREKVALDASGLPEQPIVLRAAEGEHVMLTGADRITDWTPVQGQSGVYSTPWPHKFVGWNKSQAHPDDDYHRLIGRCEQVFIDGYLLHQVLDRGKLSRGTFCADTDARLLYIQPAGNQDITGDKAMAEASTRDRILTVKGSYVTVKGICFRYAANRAQQGAVAFSGDRLLVEDCIFECTNASGAEFTGPDITVRNCTFQHNGQIGFGASRAHRLHLTGCTVRNNNTKGFDRGWEAGGDKICLTRGAVLENSTFIENRGNGIWFDIGNEDGEVRNCLIARNENAGIFYEISYGLHAHDNVIVNNGFAFTPGAWGAAAGISVSSSPGCTVERNLILGNKEGFNFREQTRRTPRIDSRKSEPVWNHDETVRHNVFAFNRDAQVWGWFDVSDERHWPKSLQTNALVVTPSGVAVSRASRPRIAGRMPATQTNALTGTLPTALSLEDLKLTFASNLYWPGPGQDLFNWGVTWKKCRKYESLEVVQKELSLEQNSTVSEFHVEDYSALDLRVPSDSPVLKMDCYPQGSVYGVLLGTAP
jgi:hypothetical protein